MKIQSSPVEVHLVRNPPRLKLGSKALFPLEHYRGGGPANKKSFTNKRKENVSELSHGCESVCSVGSFHSSGNVTCRVHATLGLNLGS